MNILLDFLIIKACWAALIALPFSVIARWATQKVAKFKPSYAMVYKSVFLGCFGGGICILMVKIFALVFVAPSADDFIILSLIFGFVFQSIIYGLMIRDPLNKSIGIRKGVAVTAIQFSFGIAFIRLIDFI